MTLPPVVDLCAATGLFARAFADEGFPVVCGYEFDEARARAWEANLRAPCVVKNVLDLSPAELRSLRDEQGRLVVIGGIPCQDFSYLNAHREEDPALRDGVLALIDTVKPAAVAVENVMNAWRGVGGVRRVVDADVGGLTTRERGFWGCPPVPQTHVEPTGTRGQQRLDGNSLQAWRGWGLAIQGYDVMADFTQQDDWESRGVLNVRRRTYPAWTITKRWDTAVWRTDERKSLRFTTLNERAKLTGFPPGWRWPKGREQRKGCIGDAVPYAMGRAIARAVRDDLARRGDA